MSEAAEKPARVELKGPDVQFAAEGAPDWVAEQLDKVLETLKERRAMADQAADAVMGAILG